MKCIRDWNQWPMCYEIQKVISDPIWKIWHKQVFYLLFWSHNRIFIEHVPLWTMNGLFSWLSQVQSRWHQWNIFATIKYGITSMALSHLLTIPDCLLTLQLAISRTRCKSKARPFVRSAWPAASTLILHTHILNCGYRAMSGNKFSVHARKTVS